MKEIRHKFFTTLFDPNDKVAWGNSANTSNKPRDPMPHLLSAPEVFFCINPLNEWRNTNNVTAFNCLLFECDDKALTPKEQIRKFIETGMPFTTMTYSGNKSIHVIVRFTEPMTDRYWHTSWWKAIALALKQYGLTMDQQAALCVQISRMPESYRQDTQKKQTSIFIKERVEQDQMREWLAKHNIEVALPKEPVKNDYVSGTNDGVSDAEKWQQAMEWHTETHGPWNANAETGNHMWLLRFGSKCWQVDLAPNVVAIFAAQEFGDTYITSAAGRQPVMKPVAKGWDNARIKGYKQYVLDKQVRKEWIKQEAAQRRVELEKQFTNYENND